MIRKKFLYIVFSGFCLAVLNGCTILGFLAGSKADTGRAVLKSPSIKKVRKIRPETLLQIQLNDYQIVEGKFRGTEQIDSTLYLQRYNAFQSDPEYTSLFPLINDTITLSRKSGLLTFTAESSCLFTGFDLNTISIHLPEYNRYSDEILDNMERIIDRQGRNLNAQIIKSYVNQGLVPLRSQVLIELAGAAHPQLRKIPGENVVMIRLPKPVSGRIIYTLLGFTVDILVIRELMRYYRWSVFPPWEMH